MPTRKLVTSYTQDLERFPDLWHKIGLWIGFPLLILFPFVASSYWLTILNQAFIAVIGSVALMILTGFAGQISLGHAAFLGIGAYTVAILGSRFHIPFWLALPIGGIFASLIGLIIGPFALRLRGLYLAIVTLGLLFLTEHILMSFPEYTGGVSGLSVPAHLGFTKVEGEGGLGTFTRPSEIFGFRVLFAHKIYFILALLALASAFLCSNIRRSTLGRSMMAVRESDLAASVIGVNPAVSKIAAFGISSFLAGIAGGAFALQQQYITIVPPFDLSLSIQYITMIVLGGVGTTFGAVAGALVFVICSPLMEWVGSHLPLINKLTNAQQSTLLFSLLVCIILIYEPLGLYGVWLKVKRYFLTWPFRY